MNIFPILLILLVILLILTALYIANSAINFNCIIDNKKSDEKGSNNKMSKKLGGNPNDILEWLKCQEGGEGRNPKKYINDRTCLTYIDEIDTVVNIAAANLIRVVILGDEQCITYILKKYKISNYTWGNVAGGSPNFSKFFTHYREIYGDGHCYYRCIIFGIFEQLLYIGDERSDLYDPKLFDRAYMHICTQFKLISDYYYQDENFTCRTFLEYKDKAQIGYRALLYLLEKYPDEIFKDIFTLETFFNYFDKIFIFSSKLLIKYYFDMHFLEESHFSITNSDGALIVQYTKEQCNKFIFENILEMNTARPNVYIEGQYLVPSNILPNIFGFKCINYQYHGQNYESIVVHSSINFDETAEELLKLDNKLCIGTVYNNEHYNLLLHDIRRTLEIGRRPPLPKILTSYNTFFMSDCFTPIMEILTIGFWKGQIGMGRQSNRIEDGRPSDFRARDNPRATSTTRGATSSMRGMSQTRRSNSIVDNQRQIDADAEFARMLDARARPSSSMRGVSQTRRSNSIDNQRQIDADAELARMLKDQEDARARPSSSMRDVSQTRRSNSIDNQRQIDADAKLAQMLKDQEDARARPSSSMRGVSQTRRSNSIDNQHQIDAAAEFARMFEGQNYARDRPPSGMRGVPQTRRSNSIDNQRQIDADAEFARMFEGQNYARDRPPSGAANMHDKYGNDMIGSLGLVLKSMEKKEKRPTQKPKSKDELIQMYNYYSQKYQEQGGLSNDEMFIYQELIDKI